MSKRLIIVEAPTKAKTIRGYLKADEIVASKGHLRSIPSKPNAIEYKGGYIFHWETVEEKFNVIREKLPYVKEILLATDMDREGEAIASHIEDLIRAEGFKGSIKRIYFYEITEKAIKEALLNPRDIDRNLVNAYFTRLGLDYKIGFGISPVLWDKLRFFKEQSAGRVQSPALRFLVEREIDRNNFKPENYYSVEGIFQQGDSTLSSKMFELEGKKLEEREKDKSKFEALLEKIQEDTYELIKEKPKKISIKPPAPLMTSTLQQEAANKLSFPVTYTMKLAQSLYEGVEIDGQSIALITYMRTDSTNMSDYAVNMIREYIKKEHPEYLPEKANQYLTKVKNAQEAHECIRAININLLPSSLKGKIHEDLQKLYDLIWRFSVACQMKNAENESNRFIFQGKHAKFSASYTIQLFDGFKKVLGQNASDKTIKLDLNLPVELKEAKLLEHVTTPPDRFTEASWLKALEKAGVGRPSTIPKIIETHKSRGYVEMQSAKLIPTAKAVVSVLFLKKYFPSYVDYEFTAAMEEKLDLISNEKLDWEKTLKEFEEKLGENIEKVKQNIFMDTFNSLKEELLHAIGKNTCDNGHPLFVGFKYGIFLSCRTCSSIQSMSQFFEYKEKKPVEAKEGEEKGTKSFSKRTFTSSRSKSTESKEGEAEDKEKNGRNFKKRFTYSKTQKAETKEGKSDNEGNAEKRFTYTKSMKTEGTSAKKDETVTSSKEKVSKTNSKTSKAGSKGTKKDA